MDNSTAVKICPQKKGKSTLKTSCLVSTYKHVLPFYKILSSYNLLFSEAIIEIYAHYKNINYGAKLTM